MKKIFLILGLIFTIINQVKAEEQQEIDEIQQQVEKYKEECYNKSYPVDDSEKMDYIFSYYNGSVKEYLPKYNNCLKGYIIEKIRQDSLEEDAVKIIEALNKIEQGVLDFYGIMYAQTDTGIYGKAINDNELGRRYEAILYDVLRYQQVYGKDSEYSKMLSL